MYFAGVDFSTCRGPFVRHPAGVDSGRTFIHAACYCPSFYRFAENFAKVFTLLKTSSLSVEKIWEQCVNEISFDDPKYNKNEFFDPESLIPSELNLEGLRTLLKDTDKFIRRMRQIIECRNAFGHLEDKTVGERDVKDFFPDHKYRRCPFDDDGGELCQLCFYKQFAPKILDKLPLGGQKWQATLEYPTMVCPFCATKLSEQFKIESNDLVPFSCLIAELAESFWSKSVQSLAKTNEEDAYLLENNNGHDCKQILNINFYGGPV